MPVRRIGLCYRSVSGRVPMGKGRPSVAVESTLERDFALLQRFDPMVASVEEQPVRIEYRESGGALRSYVPDFLVSYHRSGRPSKLVEVKHSGDPVLLAGNLEERFAAARSYANRCGWTFELATEVEIRTPRLANVTFLLPFRDRVADASVTDGVTDALCGRAPATVHELADAVAGSTATDRQRVLPALWSMIARFELIADLDRPLTMRTSVHFPKDGEP